MPARDHPKVVILELVAGAEKVHDPRDIKIYGLSPEDFLALDLCWPGVKLPDADLPGQVTGGQNRASVLQAYQELETHIAMLIGPAGQALDVSQHPKKCIPGAALEPMV